MVGEDLKTGIIGLGGGFLVAFGFILLFSWAGRQQPSVTAPAAWAGALLAFSGLAAILVLLSRVFGEEM